MQLPVLPQDKANHVVYGSAIALTSAAAVACFGFSSAVAGGAGLAAATAIGTLKEIYDKKRNGSLKLDVPDLVATVAGGAMVAVPLLFVGA